MKQKLSNLILILVFLVGLSLLLYPSVSDYVNSLHQSRAIVQYANEVSKLDTATYERLWQEAREYNRRIAEEGPSYHFTEAEWAQYEALLKIADDGVMGYVEIPSINCSLPVYHGTDEGTLQTAVGHLEWTSLPVGGESSHCVLSGHRGLPSAKLFTDLDRVHEGDDFMIRVLDEVLTYEVDQVLVVEPKDTQALHIVPGQDYCTLVTCTPYGVNSHRMLVRGHRVANRDQSKEIRVTADAMQVDKSMAVPITAAPMLVLLLPPLWLKLRHAGKKHKKQKK